MHPSDFIRKPGWAFSQLLPLTYRSRYTDNATGKRHYAVWRMWLGRVYAHDDVEIARDVHRRTA